MAKVIMVQGTMSGVGKSLITAGLLRVFKQDGHSCAPFKSQNMALNSYITNEGLEMGRAQVMQAECAGIEPLVCMNPILLKPTSDVGSQVIVNGEVVGNMSARDYFEYKKSLVPKIMSAFNRLADMVDIIVIEGAGSPAEINLKENDIVNMGMAELAGSNVLLAGDIDRGGVFAQLYGTVMLLDKKEQDRIKGLVINKFRGDKLLLDSGIEMITDKTGIPTVGVLPYVHVKIDDEDSLTERFDYRKVSDKRCVDIAVIRYPRISNFTDFNIFETDENVSVRYVERTDELGEPDIIFLPGSKNTIEDLKWLRAAGFEQLIKEYAKTKPVFGICGGMQMLGNVIADESGADSGLLSQTRGMGLLDIDTEMMADKTRKQLEGEVSFPKGRFETIQNRRYKGYELHLGQTVRGSDAPIISDGGNVYGSYVHGLFDEGGIGAEIIRELGGGMRVSSSYAEFKESQYDILAHIIRENMDMGYVYSILRDARCHG